MDIVKILNIPAVMVTLITLGLTIFSRAIIKIFNMGVAFRNKLATKNEQVTFEQEMRKMFKEAKEEITKDVLNRTIFILEREVKNIEEIKNLASEMEKSKLILEAKITAYTTDVEEIKKIVPTITSINNRLTRIEYGKDNDTTRRSE